MILTNSNSANTILNAIRQRRYLLHSVPSTYHEFKIVLAEFEFVKITYSEFANFSLFHLFYGAAEGFEDC